MKEKPKNLFSKRFRELRIDIGMQQRDVAKLLYVNRTTVSSWETIGKEPSYDTLITIAKLFNVSIDYLLGVDEFYIDK